MRRKRIKSALRQELRRLTWPLLIETLLVMMLGAIDTFMLSRHSDNSVAAVGLANQILTFCFIIFEVINLGTSVLCSQYLGAQRRDRMETVAGVALAVNLVFGLAVSAGLFCYGRSILEMLGLEGDVLELGRTYIELVGLFAFVQALQLTISAVMRSNNKPVYPMMVILVVNILNIIGNYVLIFGAFGAPALGVKGAALSTVISRAVAMIILFILLFGQIIRAFPVHIFRRWPGKELRNLLHIGLPAAGEQVSYYLSQLVLVFFITAMGMESLAARTYCVNIIMFVYLFSLAISHAGAISIGHLVGARKYGGAYLMGKYVMKVSLRLTLLFSLSTAVLGTFIMRMLTDNPEIIALGTAILWIDVVLEIGRPINILYVNALQSAGDVNYPFYVGLIVMWIVAVGGAWGLGVAAGFGLLGMWWMFALDENIRGILFIRRWNSKKWSNKGV